MSDVGVPVVLLVEDQAPTRDWMRGVLIEAFPGVEVVAQRNLKEAMAWLDGAAPPWLAVIDIGLPDGSGIDIVRRLTADFPSTRRVIATIYADDAYLLDAISAGAEGYVLKEEEPAQIVATLQRIEHDEPPLSPSIARRILAQLRDSPAPRNDDAGLTGREVETLTLLARGLTVAEVASRLGLRPHTVAGYVKIIYQKLGVSSRAEATREAIRRGLA